jgi:hypothetical protein
VTAPGARIVVEAPVGADVDLGLPERPVRRYGAAAIHVFDA